LATWFAWPFLLLYLLRRCLTNSAYREGLGERFGLLPPSFHQPAPGAIWIHAVSVGEIASCVALIEELRLRLPSERVFVSCGTIAGRQLAQRRLVDREQPLAEGLFYVPFDFVFAVRRVLRCLRPSLVVVMETEIWPHLFREVKRTKASLVVVNGRISDKAFPKYQRIRGLVGAALQHVDDVFVQGESDAARYAELGSPRVESAGNLKYDFDPPKAAIPDAIARFVEQLRPDRIWIAASTMPPANADDVDEDDAVIAAWGGHADGRSLLILVPRKPERFDVAADKLRAARIAFVRRTELELGSSDPPPNVLLLDSIGELASLFQLPAYVFMGGTLARRGGHNVLEPALFGRPVLVGPHMENFVDIAADFRKAAAVIDVADGKELGEWFRRTAAGRRSDLEFLDEVGQRGRSLAESKRGAKRRIAARLVERYDRAVPEYRWPIGVDQALEGLSLIWQFGGWIKRYRTKPIRLPAPVVSVGGLAMGGVGKTPIVRALAEFYRTKPPAILTRGYGRKSKANLVLERGARLQNEATGDEPQLYLRDGVAFLGIGADRAVVGREVYDRHKPGIYLLDDGFQHARVVRDFDVVCLDARDPFGSGFVFPRGWLRESPVALRRASAIVLTRAEPHLRYTGVSERLAKVAPGVPVYRGVLRPTGWVRLCDGARLELAALVGGEATVLAGIGQPDAFFRMLEGLGVRIVRRIVRSDHYPWNRGELEELRREKLIITTEKDFVRMPAIPYQDSWYYLHVAMEIEGFEPPSFEGSAYPGA
jgi:3-deoxy-D-manno-octulosonic-acid transferase